jgi:hypothetical protein
MAIVYIHKRKDTGQIFYVGIGKKESRAYTNWGRNNYWKDLVGKIEYSIEIIKNNISWEEACQIEKELIKSIGRKDMDLGPLVNKTNGGEGISELAQPKCICPHCNKQGVGHVMKRWHFDNCAKISKRKCQNRLICPHCNKEGEIRNIKRWHFDNCPEFTGKPRAKGKKRKPYAKRKECTLTNKKRKPGNMSDEQKRSISMAMKGVAHKKATCPHCLKEGSRSNMTRWHFNNCKTLHN